MRGFTEYLVMTKARTLSSPKSEPLPGLESIDLSSCTHGSHHHAPSAQPRLVAHDLPAPTAFRAETARPRLLSTTEILSRCLECHDEICYRSVNLKIRVLRDHSWLYGYAGCGKGWRRLVETGSSLQRRPDAVAAAKPGGLTTLLTMLNFGGESLTRDVTFPLPPQPLLGELASPVSERTGDQRARAAARLS